jgi:hypothetical protein
MSERGIDPERQSPEKIVGNKFALLLSPSLERNVALIAD